MAVAERDRSAENRSAWPIDPAAGLRAADPAAGLRAADVAAIAALTLCLGLATAWLIPLGQELPNPSCAPDELAHFGYVDALASGRFESWPDFDNRMAFFPPGQYLFQTLGLLLGRAGLDAPALYRFAPVGAELAGFPFARLGSVLLGVFAVLFLADAAAVVTGSRRAGVFAGLVAALFPQRFFQFGYVNNDAFTFACGALALAALARWARAGEGQRALAAVAVACGLLLFAKPTGYPFLVPALVWVGWAALRRRIPRRALGRAALVTAAVSVPMLAWNAVRNGGDPFGLWVYRAFVASDSWRGSEQLTFPPRPVWTFFRSLTSSSFMKFGNNDLHLPAALYLPWLAILVLGLATFLCRARGLDRGRRRMAVWLGASLALSFAAVVYECLAVDFSPQGRYVLLAAVTLTLVCCRSLAAGRGRESRLAIELGLVAYFAGVAAWSLWLLWRVPCGPPG